MAKTVYRSLTESRVTVTEKLAADGSSVTVITTRPPDAELALRWLERRFPERWSPRRAVEHSGKVAAGNGPSISLVTVGAEQEPEGPPVDCPPIDSPCRGGWPSEP